MKKIEQYKCKICGAVYASKQDCAACEKQHVKAHHIVKQFHRQMNVCAKYPHTITVAMEDGSIIEYKKGATLK